MQPSPGQEPFKFDQFQVNLSAAELRRNGRKIPIQDKPLRLLAYLSQRPGTVVTRAEIQQHLWPPDTTVGFEDGLNTAVKKLRDALNDNSDKPRYIETVRGRGYRFLAEVELIGTVEPNGTGAASPASSAAPALADAIAVAVAEPIADPVPDSAVASLEAPKQPRRFAFAVASVAGIALTAVCAIFWHTAKPAPGATHAILLGAVEDDSGQGNGAAVDRLLRQDAAQSGFRILIDRIVNDDLKQMLLPLDTPIRGQAALDICQRENLPVLLAPALVRDGSRTLLLVRALSCTDDSTVAQAQTDVTASGEAAAVESMMGDLSHQLQTVWPALPKPALRMLDATTPSMEALRAFSMAERLRLDGRYMEAVPAFRRAMLLDPTFALAAVKLGATYGHLGETQAQRTWTTAAFAQRDHVTEEERLFIDAEYYDYVTHDQRQRDAVLKLWKQLITDAPVIPTHLSTSLAGDGYFEDALPQAEEAVRGWPRNGRSYVVLGDIQLALGHPDEAVETANTALKQGYYQPTVDDLLLRSALMRDDARTVETLAQHWQTTDMQPYAAAALARIRLQQGRIGEAAALASQAAVDLRAQGMMESAQNLLLAVDAAVALDSQTAAENDGQNPAVAKPKPAPGSTPASIDSEDSAISLAMAGRTAEARGMVSRLEEAAPEYERLRDVVEAIVDASGLLQERQPQKALVRLQSCATYPHVRLECAWLRGMAQMALHQNEAALASFAEVEQWRGVDAYSTLPVLARWQQARLLASMGQPSKAKGQYSVVTETWKSADADRHLLAHVRAEMGGLR